ncbi:hypothetical protein BY458DRAFT_524427 [Sporodiniella umbellata]|nr:hypothetical protein BY458DRAFT_524427 [Sporodiniella umbellata]
MASHTAGPTGLHNVVATKFLMVLIGTLSVSASILRLKHCFHLQLIPHLSTQHQFWRLLTSHLVFSNSGDFMFGTLLLYMLRVIERQYGTTKYSSFLFVALVLSTFFEVSALVIGKNIGLERIQGGPYALIFASLYQYYRIVPVTYRFRIFGLTMTDKLYIYVLASHIAFSGWIQTFVPAMCGLLTGALYRTDVGHIKRWRFPMILRSLAKIAIVPFFSASPNPRSSTAVPIQRPIIANLGSVNSLLGNGLSNENATETETTDGSANRPAARSSTVREYFDTITNRDVAGSGLEPPSPEHTRILMTMFPDHPRETITRAQASAHNDLNRSVEIMLNTPSPIRESSSSRPT